MCILLRFMFWGTFEEYTRLLHRYILGNVVCRLSPHHLYLAFLPITYIWHFSPSPISGISPRDIPPQIPLHALHRPQCVMLPSLCPCVLTVQHPPMSENMWCLIFCSSVHLPRLMVSRFLHVPYKGNELVIFYGCRVFHGVYVPHFPCPVYRQWAFGLVPSLCYCKQCCNEHSCACVLIIETFIILWIYSQ